MIRARPGPPRRLLAAGAVAAALAVVVLTSTTQSSWSAARVTNAPDNAATGALAFSHTGTASCAAGPAVSATTSCAGTLTPTVATSGAGAVTGTDSIADTGTLVAGRIAQSLQAPSCAPVKLDDSQTPSDPMLPRSAAAFQQPDRWGTTTAAGLSGGAYAADVVATTTSTLLGGSYSLGVYFKVANGYAAGGGLIGAAASPAASATAAGPVSVWMDNAGKVRFYLAGTAGTSSSGVSAAAYNDGAWHLAVLSVSSAVGSTPTLFVDGVAVTGIGVTALTGGVAYWHLGWTDLTGVTAGGPTSPTLTGALSGAFVSGSALSVTAVATLTGAVSASAYLSLVLATPGLLHAWQLGDPGTTTYTGALPATMSAPCGRVDVAFSFTGPAAAIAQQSLAAFANGSPRSVAAPGAGATQTMTTSVTRGTGWSSDVAGLRLRVPLTFIETTSPTSSWSLTFTWSSSAAVVLA